MLQTLRAKSASLVIKILMGLLVVSFAVWGIGDIFRGSGPSNVVAEVGDVEIPSQRLGTVFQQEIQRMQPAFGGRLDVDTARQLGILDQALERVVAETLLDIKAEELGIAISDEVVRRAIRSEPMFRNAEGTFDPNILRAVLFNNNLSEAAYVEVLREDLRRRQLISSIISFDTPPATLIEQLLTFRTEKRVAETLVINANQAEIETPTEDERRAFYEENADLFLAPEYRTVTAVILTADDVLDTVAVSDEEIAAEYEARQGEFRSPETRTVEQLTFADAETAAQGADLWRGGSDMAGIAAEIGGDAQALGDVARDDLGLPELADAVFATDAGAVSDPVESPFGWHVFKVTAVNPSTVRPLDEVRDDLATAIARRKANDLLPDLGRQLDDELGGGATLEEAASVMGVDVVTFPPLDDTGNGTDGTRIEGLPDDSEFLSQAFAAEQGVTGFLTETVSGYYVLRVDSIVPRTPRPFEAVDATVTDMLMVERSQGAAEERANRLVEQIRGGASFAKIAMDEGLSIRASRAVTREDNDTMAGVSSAVTERLFAMQVGEVAMAPSDDGFTIFRLKEIRPPDMDADSTVATRIRDQALAGLREDLLYQLDRAIRAHHPVTVDRQAIDSLFY